jgi:predicted Rossmann-fold nucleotide-binding protein
LLLILTKKNKGKKFLVYFPDKREMEKVGEKEGPKADETVDTKIDYVRRNILMVENCGAILALPGSLGTFNEIIYAVNDYHKKVAVLDIGEMSAWIKSIPQLSEKVFFTKNASQAIDYLEK